MNARKEIKKALENSDFDVVCRCFQEDAALTMRVLQMHVYGMPDDILRWRAITFIGKLAGIYAADNDDLFRNVIRRFIWQMCEESANVPWASAEVIGSILANVEGSRYREFIGPWFYHVDLNEICYAGLYYILPEVMNYHSETIKEFLPKTFQWYEKYDMADLRAYACIFFYQFPEADMKPYLESWLQDSREVLLYQDDTLKKYTIHELAQKALSKFIS